MCWNKCVNEDTHQRTRREQHNTTKTDKASRTAHTQAHLILSFPYGLESYDIIAPRKSKNASLSSAARSTAHTDGTCVFRWVMKFVFASAYFEKTVIITYTSDKVDEH